MNFGENITKVLLLFIIVIVAFASYTLIEINKKTTKFYVHEKGKINLLQVKKINPRVEYYATLSQDEKVDLFRKYSTNLDINEIKNIETFLTTVKDSEFYNIEIDAYLMLDKQRVDLYNSQRYIKLPSNFQVNDYMLDILQVYGIDEFQYSELSKLKETIYLSRDEFLDKVISVAKLNKTDWVIANVPVLGLGEKSAKFLSELDDDVKENIMSDSDMNTIIEKLGNAYKKYDDIK